VCLDSDGPLSASQRRSWKSTGASQRSLEVYSPKYFTAIWMPSSYIF
jgi:hypothetical protein